MKTFKEMQEFETDMGTLLIVDSLNLAFRWKARPSKADPDPIQKEFVDDYLSVVRSLQKSYRAEKVIIACDAGSNYRRTIYPEYKQNRRDKYAEATEYEQKLFEDFQNEFQKTFDRLNQVSKWLVLKLPGVEADDIAAHICVNIKKYGLNKIWLASSDKDWSLLVTPDISQFSYVTRKEITFDNWDEHHECEIEEYISIKCLQGDPGDGVPGIHGIGPKRALALLSKYGNALDIYNALPIPGKSQYIQNLNDSGETIPRNYQLMDLINQCDFAIEPHLEDLKIKLKTYLL
jgi:5'-3' exonuclease